MKRSELLKIIKEEISNAQLDELAVAEDRKINKFLDKLETSIKDANLLKQIKRFILIQRTDPYTTFNEILEFLKIKFPKQFK